MLKEHSEKEENIQIVYAIEQGENHEGGHIEEMCETKEEAKKWVEKYINMRNKKKKWTKNTRGWESGCDYITITKWKVIKKAEDSGMFADEIKEDTKKMKSEKIEHLDLEQHTVR